MTVAEEIRAGANDIIPDFELNPHAENGIARRKVTQQLSTHKQIGSKLLRN